MTSYYDCHDEELSVTKFNDKKTGEAVYLCELCKKDKKNTKNLTIAYDYSGIKGDCDICKGFYTLEEKE